MFLCILAEQLVQLPVNKTETVPTNKVPLKEQSHVYFPYFCHKFAKFISKDLAHAKIAF